MSSEYAEIGWTLKWVQWHNALWNERKNEPNALLLLKNVSNKFCTSAPNLRAPLVLLISKHSKQSLISPHHSLSHTFICAPVVFTLLLVSQMLCYICNAMNEFYDKIGSKMEFSLAFGFAGANSSILVTITVCFTITTDLSLTLSIFSHSHSALLLSL